MKTSHPLMTGLLLLTVAGSAAAAADIELRFHPADHAWSYELEAARQLRTVVLQNTAIINRSDRPRIVDLVRYDVLRGEEVIATQSLHPADLDASAQFGGAVAAAGMMKLLDFQFAPDRLFGDGVVVSSTRTLAPGAAMHLGAQVLNFAGKPERVRITVDFEGEAPDAVATIALRHGTAPGVFRVPVQGNWVVGSGATLHSHHRWVVPQEFAMDFAQYGESGGTYRRDGSRPEHYYGYGKPVVATADGEVVASIDKFPDSVGAMRRPGESLAAYQQRLREMQGELLAAGLDAITGNHVVLRHDDGVHSVYGHLKPGSVAVAVGDVVRAGQVLGKVGTSGNSTEPHLHFHLCDGPDSLRCAGMPVAFVDAEIPVSESPRLIQSGDLLMPAVAAEPKP